MAFVEPPNIPTNHGSLAANAAAQADKRDVERPGPGIDCENYITVFMTHMAKGQVLAHRHYHTLSSHTLHSATQLATQVRMVIVKLVCTKRTLYTMAST